MITTCKSIVIGAAGRSGIWQPDTAMIGGMVAAPVPADTIFIQNDSNTNPASPWYITQIDATHYAMPNATAPKGWQYLGAFIVDGATGVRGGRADGAVWTFSDPEMVQHITTSSAGQAAISILKPGTSTLTVTLRGMVSTLVITATKQE